MTALTRENRPLLQDAVLVSRVLLGGLVARKHSAIGWRSAHASLHMPRALGRHSALDRVRSSRSFGLARVQSRRADRNPAMGSESSNRRPSH
jgi:hypothetical protein